MDRQSHRYIKIPENYSKNHPLGKSNCENKKQKWIVWLCYLGLSFWLGDPPLKKELPRPEASNTFGQRHARHARHGWFFFKGWWQRKAGWRRKDDRNGFLDWSYWSFILTWICCWYIKKKKVECRYCGGVFLENPLGYQKITLNHLAKRWYRVLLRWFNANQHPLPKLAKIDSPYLPYF